MILKIFGKEKPPSCKCRPLYQEENPMFTIKCMPTWIEAIVILREVGVGLKYQN